MMQHVSSEGTKERHHGRTRSHNAGALGAHQAQLLQVAGAAPLAGALLAVGGLTASTSASAATTNSSGNVVTNVVEGDASVFYDPASDLLLVIGLTLSQLCNRDAADAYPYNIQTVKTSAGVLISNSAFATNAPAYLYQTSTPTPTSADLYAACAAGAFSSPDLVGTGTASTQWFLVNEAGTSGTPSGIWEQTASGTFVDASTGETCKLGALDVGPWANKSFDIDALIDTFGC